MNFFLKNYRILTQSTGSISMPNSIEIETVTIHGKVNKTVVYYGTASGISL